MTDTTIPAGHGDLPVYLATPADQTGQPELTQPDLDQ
jgi:hypothetical protein